MNEPLEDWIALASVARSYRRKFDLARYIDSRSENPALTAAAARVLDSLAEVIDSPIADAAVLKRANGAFFVLRRVLNAAAKTRTPVAYPSAIDPPQARMLRNAKAVQDSFPRKDEQFPHPRTAALLSPIAVRPCMPAENYSPFRELDFHRQPLIRLPSHRS